MSTWRRRRRRCWRTCRPRSSDGKLCDGDLQTSVSYEKCAARARL